MNGRLNFTELNILECSENCVNSCDSSIFFVRIRIYEQEQRKLHINTAQLIAPTKKNRSIQHHFHRFELHFIAMEGPNPSYHLREFLLTSSLYADTPQGRIDRETILKQVYNIVQPRSLHSNLMLVHPTRRTNYDFNNAILGLQRRSDHCHVL